MATKQVKPLPVSDADIRAFAVFIETHMKEHKSIPVLDALDKHAVILQTAALTLLQFEGRIKYNFKRGFYYVGYAENEYAPAVEDKRQDIQRMASAYVEEAAKAQPRRSLRR